MPNNPFSDSFFGDDDSTYNTNIAGHENSNDDFFGDYTAGMESFRLEGAINPDIGSGDSTITTGGDIQEPPINTPDQPNSDNSSAVVMPDEDSFRASFFSDMDGDTTGTEPSTDDITNDLNEMPPAGDDLPAIALRRVKDEQAALASAMYQINLVRSMITLMETFDDSDGKAARAILAALDPDNNLAKTQEMAGCSGLYASNPTAGLEGIELTGVLTGLRKLWEAMKNKVFRTSSAPTTLELVSATLAPAIKNTDEVIATSAAVLAAHYATKQVTDEMIASATSSQDYVILTPKGVTDVANTLGALHGIATKAVSEVLPTDMVGLRTYCEKLSKIMEPVMSKFGLVRSVEGVVTRNIAYGSISKDLVHVPAGKTLSSAGYTTQKQVLDAAKVISEKCQMSTVAAVMTTFANSTIQQLATIAGTVSTDNKAQVDERIAVTKAAAIFTLTVLDEVARQVVSEVVVSWIDGMHILPCSRSGCATESADAALAWRYTKPVSSAELSAISSRWGITPPSDFLHFVMKNNGGRPSANNIVTRSGKSRVFDHLISVVSSDAYNVFTARDAIVHEHKQTDLYPFGADPFGGVFCFRTSGGVVKDVVFLSHDPEAVDPICNSFTELLSMLK